ncbi:hypothetical protein ALC56_14189 [Trachymyrmex septentrionalis]|uniref:Uncharacterized protein n=1 Tax=Trachymyrmex septentrionalis TaxID=34720 RepID=A0A195ESU8_9HYME|nr:hypothetical protein ALC56_14189 [Trachymyrmex septentrionalis]
MFVLPVISASNTSTLRSSIFMLCKVFNWFISCTSEVTLTSSFPGDSICIAVMKGVKNCSGSDFTADSRASTATLCGSSLSDALAYTFSVTFAVSAIEDSSRDACCGNISARWGTFEFGKEIRSASLNSIDFPTSTSDSLFPIAVLCLAISEGVLCDEDTSTPALFGNNLSCSSGKFVTSVTAVSSIDVGEVLDLVICITLLSASVVDDSPIESSALSIFEESITLVFARSSTVDAGISIGNAASAWSKPSAGFVVNEYFESSRESTVVCSCRVIVRLLGSATSSACTALGTRFASIRTVGSSEWSYRLSDLLLPNLFGGSFSCRQLSVSSLRAASCF